MGEPTWDDPSIFCPEYYDMDKVLKEDLVDEDYR